MDTHAFDIVVIGAGIAGATAAAQLAADHRVALVEAEEAAGYHTTSRSAAMWMQNYGPHDARTLSRLSKAFFDAPPPGFTETPLLTRRAVVYIATDAHRGELDAMLKGSVGLRDISIAEARGLVPAIHAGYRGSAAVEDIASDMDVAAIHQGFLRLLRARGGVLALRSRAGRIVRHSGNWRVETTENAVFSASILVNAAGAWGDEVAAIAGVTPIGLQPKRRTALIIDPAPWEVASWPMLDSLGETWYCRPEARKKLLVSPADETDMPAHDVQPDELDIAIAIDRMQSVLDIKVHRVERSWAGLRSFTPDRGMAIGWDGAVDGFFWSLGQGGYGIQTSPAQGKLVADLVSGRDPGPAGAILERVDPKRFRTPKPV